MSRDLVTIDVSPLETIRFERSSARFDSRCLTIGTQFDRRYLTIATRFDSHGHYRPCFMIRISNRLGPPSNAAESFIQRLETRDDEWPDAAPDTHL